VASYAPCWARGMRGAVEIKSREGPARPAAYVGINSQTCGENNA
jgi:hypothetical protein